MGGDEGVLEEAVEGEEAGAGYEGIHNSQSEKEDAEGVHGGALICSIAERMAEAGPRQVQLGEKAVHSE